MPDSNPLTNTPDEDSSPPPPKPEDEATEASDDTSSESPADRPFEDRPGNE